MSGKYGEFGRGQIPLLRDNFLPVILPVYTQQNRIIINSSIFCRIESFANSVNAFKMAEKSVKDDDGIERSKTSITRRERKKS